METPQTPQELAALAHRVEAEITAKLEDFDARADAERDRLRRYYEKRKHELEAGRPALVDDPWQDREWWA